MCKARSRGWVTTALSLPDTLLNINKKKNKNHPRYNQPSARWDARRMGMDRTLSNDPPQPPPAPKNRPPRTSLLAKPQSKQARWGPALSDPQWDTAMTCSHLCGRLQEWLKPERFTVPAENLRWRRSAKQLACGRRRRTDGWEPAPQMRAQ